MLRKGTVLPRGASQFLAKAWKRSEWNGNGMEPHGTETQPAAKQRHSHGKL